VRQIYDALKWTMALPEVQKPIRDSGTEIFVTSPEEFARFIDEETKTWGGVLKGLSVEQR
jgi:tripartite-type tricarboxylate transporter receptor subunit TctC